MEIQTRSVDCRKLIVVLAIAFIASHVSAQSTIVSTIDGGSGFGEFSDGAGGIYAVAAGWTQTSSYQNVSIAAELNGGGGGTITGIAYLMTELGPSTTTANVLATADFTATSPISGYPPDLVTLFNGLTIGSGTYYLVIAGSGGGWECRSVCRYYCYGAWGLWVELFRHLSR